MCAGSISGLEVSGVCSSEDGPAIQNSNPNPNPANMEDADAAARNNEIEDILSAAAPVEALVEGSNRAVENVSTETEPEYWTALKDTQTDIDQEFLNEIIVDSDDAREMRRKFELLQKQYSDLMRENNRLIEINRLEQVKHTEELERERRESASCIESDVRHREHIQRLLEALDTQKAQKTKDDRLLEIAKTKIRELEGAVQESGLKISIRNLSPGDVALFLPLKPG